MSNTTSELICTYCDGKIINIYECFKCKKEICRDCFVFSNDDIMFICKECNKICKIKENQIKRDMRQEIGSILEEIVQNHRNNT